MTKKTRPMPPLSVLRECFDLTEAGLLIWKTRPKGHFPFGGEGAFNARFPGTAAGHSKGK